jgi:hypothetical protein
LTSFFSTTILRLSGLLLDFEWWVRSDRLKPAISKTPWIGLIDKGLLCGKHPLSMACPYRLDAFFQEQLCYFHMCLCGYMDHDPI